MTSFDAIRDSAREDLTIRTEAGDEDLLVWEHAERVAANARWIAGLPEVEVRSPDEVAVYAAALYHDAGWVLSVHDGEIQLSAIQFKRCSAVRQEQAAALLSERLAPLLPVGSLERATSAIRSLSAREFNSVEAVVVNDAASLDEFGLVGLWPMIRRGTGSGRAVRAALDKWRTQQDFRYWEHLLNDSFQLEYVRQVATRRLEALARFMEELERQHEGHDRIQGVAAESRLT